MTGDSKTVDGGAGDDKIAVNGNGNSVNGGAGNDSIRVSGSAQVFLGTGKDSLVLAAGASASLSDLNATDDRLFLDDAVSSASYDSASKTITFHGATQKTKIVLGGNLSLENLKSLKVKSGSTTQDLLKYLLNGTNNADTMIFDVSGETVNGKGGNDTIAINGNGNTIDGGADNDSITATGGGNSVSGGTGNDKINVSGGTSSSVNSVSGGEGDDEIIIGGNALVTMGGGADTLKIGENASVSVSDFDLNNDRLDASGDATLNLSTGELIFSNATVTSNGFNNFDSVKSVKSVNSGNSGNMEAVVKKVIGTDNDDTVNFSGDGKTVELNGGAGNDVITAKSNSNNNSLVGGDGGDTLTANGNNNTLDGGADSVFVGDNGSADVILGTGDADSLNLGAGASVTLHDLRENDGDKIILRGITGRAEYDPVTNTIIFQDEGKTTINLGTGADSISLNSIKHIKVESDGKEKDLIRYLADAGEGSVGANINLVVDNESINGGKDNDTIGAKGEKNTINGGGGNDSIVAEGDNNSVNGGTGADSITANGEGNNIVAGSGKDSVYIV